MLKLYFCIKIEFFKEDYVHGGWGLQGGELASNYYTLLANSSSNGKSDLFIFLL